MVKIPFSDYSIVVVLSFTYGYFHWAGGRLTARSREVSKPRDSGLNFFKRPEIYRHIGSSAASLPVKFQSGTIIIASNLTARIHESLRLDDRPLSE